MVAHYHENYAPLSTAHDDEVRQYTSAVAACEAFVRMGDDLPGQVGAIDVERAIMSTYNASPTHGVSDSAIDAIDRRRQLLEVFRRVCAKVHNTHGAKWWRVYYAVRFEHCDTSACGYTARHVRRVLRRVDEWVEQELFERDLLKSRYDVDLYAEEQRNAQPRNRVQVAYGEIPTEE